MIRLALAWRIRMHRGEGGGREEKGGGSKGGEEGKKGV